MQDAIPARRNVEKKGGEEVRDAVAAIRIKEPAPQQRGASSSVTSSGPCDIIP
jgi:hypothetical protein